MVSESLTTAYWQLGDNATGTTGRALRRAPATVRLVLATARAAAPGRTAAVLALQAVAGLVGAFGLLATTAVLTELLAAGPTAERVVAALGSLALVVGALAVRGCAELGIGHAQAGLGPAVRRFGEERLLDAALRADAASFEDPAFHDWLHRARDRGLVQLEQACGNLVAVLGAALGLAGAAGALGVLHPVLLPVLVLSVVPEGWAVLRAAQLRHAGLARMVALDRRTRMVADLGTDRAAAAELRACQAEDFLLGRYREAADVLRDETTRVETASARTQAVGRTVAGFALGVTIALLVLLVYAGWIPLAVGGTALIAVRAARAALAQLVRTGNQLLEQGLYVEDYRRFLDEAATRARGRGGAAVPAAPAEISLRDVAFRYPGVDARPALDGVTLTIRRGETIALVGVNGSGKTTLAKVIAGLHRPTGGQVRWDGTDLADLDPDALADRVMMVQQVPIRWPENARTNILVGRHDRHDPDGTAVRAAALAARADEVVDALPQGWETLLSKEFRGGRDLSAGQWQRIAIARGLFRDAPLLIWDEPTAPLDAAAEFAVFESLRAVAAGRTAVLITHRLASVRHVDRIVLLHDGVVAEQGTHDELLARDGRYAAMYRLQSRMYAGAGDAG